MKASDIYSEWGQTLIYINESSTSLERNIFKTIREIAQKNKFKSVWLTNGVTHVRKSDDALIIKIRTNEDLVEFVAKYPEPTVDGELENSTNIPLSVQHVKITD